MTFTSEKMFVLQNRSILKCFLHVSIHKHDKVDMWSGLVGCAVISYLQYRKHIRCLTDTFYNFILNLIIVMSLNKDNSRLKKESKEVKKHFATNRVTGHKK